MSVHLSWEGVTVKQPAQTLKEASPASAHLVSLVMEGVMEVDAQVGYIHFSHHCICIIIIIIQCHV